MKLEFVALLAAAALGSELRAQDSGWSETRFHRVHLRNGNFVDGSMVQDTSTEVVLKLASGELGIRKDQVARDGEGRLLIEFIKMRSYREAPPLVKVKPPVPIAETSGEKALLDIDPPKKIRTSDPAADKPPAGGQEKLARLLDRLKKSPPGMKPDVVQAIIALGREGALFLASSLAELDETALVNATFALGAIKEPEVLPILRRLLSNANPSVRMGVAEALGAAGDSSDLSRLRPLLADPDNMVRSAVISTLAKLKDRQSFDAIVKALVDPDASVRKQAIGALTSLAGQFDLKYEFRRALSDALDRTQGAVRIDLIRQAGASHDKDLSAVLIRLLSEDDAEARAHTISALAEMDARDAVDPIMRQIAIEREYWPRIQLAAAAEKMRLSRAIDPLIEWLNDRDPNIQIAASRALRGLTGQNLGVNQQAWADWRSKSKQ